MKDLFLFYTSSLMVKQRTPNSQDERSNRSAYDKLSGIGVTVACKLWRLGAVVRLHHIRKQKFPSISSAGRTAHLGCEGHSFKSSMGDLLQSMMK